MGASQPHDVSPLTQDSLRVAPLGPRTIPSPLGLSSTPDDGIADYVPDDARVLMEIETREGASFERPLLLEKAGPREQIFFDPKEVSAAIVTCGGLCPGINNVVRSMVLELHHKYGVGRIVGYKYGFAGLRRGSPPPLPLTPADVRHIHRQGGSFLGISRGNQDPKEMIDCLLGHRIDILFTIGGDGTLRAAKLLAEEVERRGARIAILGVPKTVDNDVAFVDKTFGYETAIDVARQAVDAAHTEATSAFNGIGIVKLMGRDAGFIAASATLASRDVNFCLIPELRWDLEGPSGLLVALEKRLAERAHAVVVVAEGCGASLAGDGAERDPSGNIRYTSPDVDIGTRLRDGITAHFKRKGVEVAVKYIDPSYMIRGVPANAQDSIFCDALARNAVHAAMAGKTNIVIGRMHRQFTHVPLGVATSRKKRVDPDGDLWLAVTEATGQPRLYG